MKVAIFMTFNKLVYHEEISWEEQIKNAEKLIESVRSEKESGKLIDVYGLPGEDTTLWLYDLDSLEAVEKLFMNDMDRYLTYDVHYLTDFEEMMKIKLEHWKS